MWFNILQFPSVHLLHPLCFSWLTCYLCACARAHKHSQAKNHDRHHSPPGFTLVCFALLSLRFSVVFMDPGFSWRNDGRVCRSAGGGVRGAQTHAQARRNTRAGDAAVHLRRRAAGADVTEKPERRTAPEVVSGISQLMSREGKEEERKMKQRSAPLNSGAPSVKRNGPLGSFTQLLFLFQQRSSLTSCCGMFDLVTLSERAWPWQEVPPPLAARRF